MAITGQPSVGHRSARAEIPDRTSAVMAAMVRGFAMTFRGRLGMAQSNLNR